MADKILIRAWMFVKLMSDKGDFMPDFVGCLALILGSGILTLLEILNMQKQSSGCVLRNFVKFIGIYLCQSLFLNKVAGLSVKLY